MSQPQDLPGGGRPDHRADEPEIADASFLLDDDAPGVEPKVGRASAGPAPTAGDEYDLIDVPEDEEDGTPAPPIPPPVARRPKPTQGPDVEPRPRPRRKSADLDADDAEASDHGEVTELWSRGAEWGPTVGVLVLAGLMVAGLAFVLMSVGQVLLALGALALGAIALVALAYPILITLERPVRLTPEQALKDYLGALNHARPHYRRMWALLADRGRVCREYADFAEFRAYWERRRAADRARARMKGVLTYQVAEFKSEEKSAGKTAIEGMATVNVTVRGKDGEELIVQPRYKLGFVRGSDRMWYVERGTLPEGKK